MFSLMDNLTEKENQSVIFMSSANISIAGVSPSHLRLSACCFLASLAVPSISFSFSFSVSLSA